MTTEQSIIDLFSFQNTAAFSGVKVGIGDDCAVLEGNKDEDWLVTTDALLEGVHFRRDFTDLITLGKKTLAVNLSDIAAMGGKPCFATISIGLPPSQVFDDAQKLSQGIREIAHLYNVAVIGGDTCRSKHGLFLSVTLLGTAPKEQAILRKGAQPGDAIYITGVLGASALGLICLEKNFSTPESKHFIAHHRLPIPRVEMGQRLRETKCVTSMIDISDGLLRDLSHITEASKVGFELQADKIPTAPAFKNIAAQLEQNHYELMLSGGEDYELLFTVAAQKKNEFERYMLSAQQTVSLTKIGEVKGDRSEKKVIDKNGRELSILKQGFDHFL